MEGTKGGFRNGAVPQATVPLSEHARQMRPFAKFSSKMAWGVDVVGYATRLPSS